VTRRRLPLRVSEIVAVVVALSLGYLVTDHLPLNRTDEAPFVRSVERDQTAHLTYADVEVLDVRAAHFLSPQFSSDLVTPAGVFVLVTAELTATREPTPFATAQLVDDRGRKYLPSEKSSCPTTPQGQTGVPTYVLFCFDVPTGVLTQLHFQVARGGNLFKTTRNDDLADLDLGIDRTQAAAMARSRAAYQVVDQSDEPFTLSTVTVTGPSS
jgi:hypothetical protein